MTDLVLVLVLAVMTYLMRIGFVTLLADRQPGPLFQRLADQVKPAAMTALAVTALLNVTDLGVAHLMAVAVVFVGSRRGVGLLVTLIAGMSTFSILSWIL